MKKSTVYLVLATVAVSVLLVVVGVVLGANISSKDGGLIVGGANAIVSTTPVDSSEPAIDNGDGSIVSLSIKSYSKYKYIFVAPTDAIFKVRFSAITIK